MSASSSSSPSTSPSLNEHGVAEPTARGWYWIRNRHNAWTIVYRFELSLVEGDRECPWSMMFSDVMLDWLELAALEVRGPIEEPRS